MSRKAIIATAMSYSLLWSTVFCASAQAAEVDPYLTWGRPLHDALDTINTYLTREVKVVLDQVNSKRFPRSCESVVNSIGLHFAFPYERKTRTWVEEVSNIEQFPPSNTSHSEHVAMSIFKTSHENKFLPIANSLRVNGINMGSDKFSHMISMGFLYWWLYQRYFRSYKRRMSVDMAVEKAKRKVIQMGLRSEQRILGGWTTKVISYSDLESNYQGMVFYTDMCKGLQPMLRREESDATRSGTKWVLDKAIDISNYVNPHFDEAYYPSVITKSAWSKIREEVRSHCGQLRNEETQKMFQRYRKKARPSFNTLYLDELIEKGTLPDNRPFGIHHVCAEAP